MSPYPDWARRQQLPEGAMLHSQGPRAVNSSYLVGIGDMECLKVSHLSYTTWCPVGGREREGEGCG